MNSLSRQTISWSIVKASVGVMVKEKKLLVFPVLISCITVVVAVLFLAPVVLQTTGHRLSEFAHWQAVVSSLVTMKVISRSAQGQEGIFVFTPKGFAYFCVAYIVSMLMATFFNVAFYSEILHALRGNTVSLSRGLRFAAHRWVVILQWALLAGLVGIVIERLSQQLDWMGRWVVSLIGVAWSTATVFVIPIVVMEPEQNPLVLLRKSAAIVKKTWGESVIGYLGLQGAGVGLIVAVVAVILGTAITATAVTHDPLCMFAGFALIPVAVAGILCVTSVARSIFQCGLYLYAAEGRLSGPFNPDMMDTAWKIRATPKS